MVARAVRQPFWRLYNVGGICGLLLLARPLIHLLFSRQRDLNSYSSIDTTAVVFILYAVVCFFFSLRELNGRWKSCMGHWLLASSPVLWLMLYYLWGSISSFWSVNPLLTAFRSFECVSMLLTIAVVFQHLFRYRSYDLVIRWTLLYATVDILFALVGYLRWTTNIGMLLQASQMFATTFFFLAVYYVPRRWYNYLIVLMSLFSMSTVAYIGMALGSLSGFWRKTNLRIYLFFFGMIIGCLLMLFGSYTVLKKTIFFDKQNISIHETSGRDLLMEVSLETLENTPFGLGFFAGEPYVLYTRRLGAISAHNSFFSGAIGLGIPGIVLLGFFFAAMMRTLFSRYVNMDHRAALIGCFCVAFLHCMGNPGLGSRVFGAWIPVTYLFVLICAFYVRGRYCNRRDIMSEE